MDKNYIEKLALLADSADMLVSAILPEILKYLENNNHIPYIIKEKVFIFDLKQIHIYCSQCPFYLDIEYSSQQIKPSLDFDLLKIKCDRGKITK